MHIDASLLMGAVFSFDQLSHLFQSNPGRFNRGVDIGLRVLSAAEVVQNFIAGKEDTLIAHQL